MTKRESNAAAIDLRDAVTDLVSDRTVKVLGDDGMTQAGPLPSLWQQARAAVRDSGENNNRGGGSAARPPYDIDLAAT